MLLKKLFLLLLLLLVFSLNSSAFAQNVPGLRVMSAQELVMRADAIVRGKIVKVEKANYLGTYTQLVTIRIADVITGDLRWQGTDIKFWAGSRIMNASDLYVKDSDVLVFLEREQTLHFTLNFQYGQFLIENENVKNWRVPVPSPPPTSPAVVTNSSQTIQTIQTVEDPTTRLGDFILISKGYGEVRKEIEVYLRFKQEPRKKAKR